MLEYDISEGIDIKKCKETSRECSLLSCKLVWPVWLSLAKFG